VGRKGKAAAAAAPSQEDLRYRMAAPAGVTRVRVRIPDGMQPGQIFRMRGPLGRMFNVTVPAQVPADRQMTIDLPAPPVAPPAEPPLLTITVPDGCGPGSQVRVRAPDGQIMTITVPNGSGPGSQIRVRAPPQTQRAQAQPPPVSAVAGNDDPAQNTDAAMAARDAAFSQLEARRNAEMRQRDERLQGQVAAMVRRGVGTAEKRQKLSAQEKRDVGTLMLNGVAKHRARALLRQHGGDVEMALHSWSLDQIAAMERGRQPQQEAAASSPAGPEPEPEEELESTTMMHGHDATHHRQPGAPSSQRQKLEAFLVGWPQAARQMGTEWKRLVEEGGGRSQSERAVYKLVRDTNAVWKALGRLSPSWRLCPATLGSLEHYVDGGHDVDLAEWRRGQPADQPIPNGAKLLRKIARLEEALAAGTAAAAAAASSSTSRPSKASSSSSSSSSKNKKLAAAAPSSTPSSTASSASAASSQPPHASALLGRWQPAPAATPPTAKAATAAGEGAGGTESILLWLEAQQTARLLRTGADGAPKVQGVRKVQALQAHQPPPAAGSVAQPASSVGLLSFKKGDIIRLVGSRRRAAGQPDDDDDAAPRPSSSATELGYVEVASQEDAVVGLVPLQLTEPLPSTSRLMGEVLQYHLRHIIIRTGILN
jgi:hypothetical protein